jgi:beta-lactamase regulating signal transducer with metallopeptidase domain
MIAGTVGFCLFILEEASQIATFSTFMSKNNQDYELVLAAADLMDYNNKIIRIINKYIGWINPLGYISYNQYANAQKIYADECILFVLRNQPELLNDREIEITFTPKEIINLANRYMYRNGKISMISERLESIKSMSFKGKVENGQIHYLEETIK